MSAFPAQFIPNNSLSNPKIRKIPKSSLPMASGKSENREDPMNNSAGTEEETIAQRQKRLRRVSFADREITSIHIFKRDEDYETPPNSSASKPQNGEQADTSESEDKVIRFFGEFANSEDTEGDGDGDGDGEDEAVVEKLFLRPKGSPSSGGRTIGSATRSDDGTLHLLFSKLFWYSESCN